MVRVLLFVLCLYVLPAVTSCKDEDEAPATSLPDDGRLKESLGRVGNKDDIDAQPAGGVVLMGGSTDVDDAIRWMIERSGGGDLVILRASGSNGYNSYVFAFGGLNSVETLLINSREKANSPAVEERIRKAEAVFIAGGDQANYINYWKDTRVEAALQYLITEKKCPIGGTSAGNAILGAFYFGALEGMITSPEALANPFDSRITIGRKDFLTIPVLNNTITDTHFNNPDRKGRLLTFMARITKEENVLVKGIGVEEKTALCIDANGMAVVKGEGDVYLLRQNSIANKPEVLSPNTMLHWYHEKEALSLSILDAESSAATSCNLIEWTMPSKKNIYVNNGVVRIE